MALSSKEKLNKVFFLLSIVIITVLIALLFLKRLKPSFETAPYSIKLIRVIGVKSKLKGPADVFFGVKNNIYVVDSGNSRIIKFDINGRYLRQWGIEGKATGEFMVPLYGSAHGNPERIFIVDSGNERIQVFKPDGSFVTEFGKTSNPKRLLTEPTFLGFAYGKIYIANSGADNIQIYFKNGRFYEKESPKLGNGNLAGKHQSNGKSNVNFGGAMFKKPVSMAFSGKYIYVSDYGLSRIFVFNRQFNYIGSIGVPGDNGYKLFHPVGIVYKNGYLYVANYGRSILTVFKLDNGYNVVKTYNFGMPGIGSKNFNHESNISISKNGKYLAVADTNNDSISLYRIFGAN